MVRLMPAQIRGARAMLNWSMFDLAKAAKVSVSTVKRAEESGTSLVSQSTVNLLKAALETAGMDFLPDAGQGYGIRLRSHEASPVARFF